MVLYARKAIAGDAASTIVRKFQSIVGREEGGGEGPRKGVDGPRKGSDCNAGVLHTGGQRSSRKV